MKKNVQISTASAIKDAFNLEWKFAISADILARCCPRYSKSTLIPTSYTSPARPPYIHKKNKKQFSQKYVQKNDF